MDQTNSNCNCKRHSNSPLEFIQVKNVNQSINKDIFYCSSCINQDLSFKGVEHILIKQIAIEGETHIIQKWPPIDNQQLIEQLIQAAASTQSHSTAEQSITNFFSMLKNEISNHIDTCQKKMVNLIKNQSFDGESILKEYQAISQIGELQKILLSGNQADLYQKEQSCKDFIMSVEEKNDENTEKLQDLLNKSKQRQSVLNFKLPNQIKESILAFIDSINFFSIDENNINLNGNNLSNENIQHHSISDKIMKLISNKSNYCSDEFLKEIKEKLSHINCLLSSLSFENQFQANKQPISFEELTNEQLDILDKHVKHLSKLQRNEEYLREIKNTKEIKSLKSVLSIKSNFIDNNFINNFEGYLIETQPYLRSINFENMITESDRFNKMLSVSEEAINKMLSPSQQMNNNIQVISDQSNPQKIDIMQHLQLEQEKYQNNNQLGFKINKLNNQIEVDNKTESWKNCISNLILEKGKKYIFRFQLQTLNNGVQNFMIGLMKSEDLHQKGGWETLLSCQLQYNQQSQVVEKYIHDYGISNKINRKELKLNTTNNEEIELRVCLEEQTLEILDFPNYNFKIGVDDKYKQNLMNFKDLRLFISQLQINQKILLKSAQIVNSW